jgi:hypothetical protein
MKRMIFISLLVLSFLVVPVAMAASAHLIKADASIDNSLNLVVSWKEAGLGNDQSIAYLVTADATATYACINSGGKHPQASNKETVDGPVTGSGTFSSGKNGTISASLTVAPPGPPDFCPTGQQTVLVEVTYSNIVLQDATNLISVDLGSLSKSLNINLLP